MGLMAVPINSYMLLYIKKTFFLDPVPKCLVAEVSGNRFLLPPYSNFVSKMHRFRDIATYWLKIAEKPTPLSFDVPCPANPLKYLHKPYLATNIDLWSTFLLLIVWVYLHSYFCGGLRQSPKDIGLCVM